MSWQHLPGELRVRQGREYRWLRGLEERSGQLGQIYHVHNRRLGAVLWWCLLCEVGLGSRLIQGGLLGGSRPFVGLVCLCYPMRGGCPRRIPGRLCVLLSRGMGLTYRRFRTERMRYVRMLVFNGLQYVVEFGCLGQRDEPALFPVVRDV